VVLVDTFERIENVFGRLAIYAQITLTAGMRNAIVKVMAEVLGILALVTKDIGQNSASESITRDISRLFCSLSFSGVSEEAGGDVRS